MKIFKKIAEIIFPNHCLYCEKIISSEGLFCNDCWQKLQFITEPKCRICCNPFEFLPAGRSLICAKCLETKPPFDNAISIFRYNSVIGKIVSDLKYRDRTYIAKKLACFLSKAATEAITEADFIIAVPLHKNRLYQRKFNQSLILCKAIAKHAAKTKLRHDFLLRIKNTPAQVGLNKRQRQKNIVAAFKLNSKYCEIVKDKKILLLDDIMTTGTTLTSCAKILKKSGAAKVTLLTLARTVFN